MRAAVTPDGSRVSTVESRQSAHFQMEVESRQLRVDSPPTSTEIGDLATLDARLSTLDFKRNCRLSTSGMPNVRMNVRAKTLGGRGVCADARRFRLVVVRVAPERCRLPDSGLAGV